ncbi:O-antigen ligase family protein [Ureibacillus composti]
MNQKKFVFTKFWMIFLFFSFIGVAYNYIILNQISGTIPSLIFDTMAYLLILITCFSLEVYILHTKEIDIWILLKKIYLYSSCILLILFIISKFVHTVLGLPLLYYEYFTPFASNPHHTAMFIAPLPFLGLAVLSKEKSINNKLLVLTLIISNFILGTATGSTKLIMGFILGSMVFLIFSIFSSIKNSKSRKLFIMTISMMFLSFLLLLWNPIITFLSAFFVEKDSGGARETIYNYGIDKAFNSFFIGYGPGAHSRIQDRYIDAHETLLTSFLQAGIFGLLAFLYLVWKIFKQCRNNPYIFGAISSIMVYVLGGDVLRRLPIWIFLILFYYYCSEKRINK